MAQKRRQKAIPLQGDLIELNQTPAYSGRKVYLMSFDSLVQIDYITFTNYYSASISLHYSTTTRQEWLPLLRNYTLMHDPHCEDGGQDFVCLSRDKFLLESRRDRIKLLKVELRQPSPHWAAFDVHAFKTFTAIYIDIAQEDRTVIAYEDRGPPPVEGAAPVVEQICTQLDELVQNAVSLARVERPTSNRFEVDNSYSVRSLWMG
eukprot:Colp12_sorted_trinity150504_noHs@15323